jgi:hypothetical protein
MCVLSAVRPVAACLNQILVTRYGNSLLSLARRSLVAQAVLRALVRPLSVYTG